MASEASKVSRRDNFPASVIQILYKRSGGKCCKCGATTFGPHTGRQDKYQNIGQAAHIAAAAPGGPRYDPRMSQEKRTSAANGLWLCSNCHSIIDKDTSEYTTAILKELKRRGEDRARMIVGVANAENPNSDRVDETPDILRATISATSIVEIRKAKSSLLQLHGQTVTQEDAETFLDTVSFINLETDSYRPEVGSELITFLSKLSTYCTNPEVNLEVIRKFKFILETFDSSWSKQEVEIVGNTLCAMTKTFDKKSMTYQSALALLKDIGRNSALRAKKLHTIVLELMKDINQSGRKRKKVSGDYVDLPEKFLRQDEEGGTGAGVFAKGYMMEEEEGEVCADDDDVDFVDYLESMAELVEAEDDRIGDLEKKLTDMGYEPNII